MESRSAPDKGNGPSLTEDIVLNSPGNSIAIEQMHAPGNVLGCARVGPCIDFSLRLLAFLLLYFISFIFLVLFSEAFHGEEIFHALSRSVAASSILFWVAVLLLVIMYLFDASYWAGRKGALARRSMVSVISLVLFACFIVSAEQEPTYPMAAYLLGLPLVAEGLRRTVLSHAPHKKALQLLSFAFLASSITAMAIFFWWAATEDGAWSIEHRDKLNGVLDCNDVVDGDILFVDGINGSTHELEITENQRMACLAGFMLWVSPLAMSVMCMMYAVTLFLMARVLSTKADKQEFANSAARFVTMVICIAVVGAWSAAAIAGVGMRLAHTIETLCFVLIVAVLLIIGNTIGFGALANSMNDSPMMSLVRSAASSNLARALTLYFLLPFAICYLALSSLNQLVRQATYVVCPCVATKRRKLLDEQERTLTHKGVMRVKWLTPIANSHVAMVVDWEWAPVLLLVGYIGLTIWALQLGTTLTYMGLAVLIEWLITLHWVLVTFLFFIIGIIMFIVPVIPGLAVYLSAGVILGPTCADTFGGFIPASIYGAFMAWIMKFFAHILQQKWLGESLGSKLWVRQAVGINAPLMKAVRYLLEQPGLSLGKVMILCGGPDWPTSVLCGILRCPLPQILLGLSPICTYSFTSTLAGAFQLKIDDGAEWASAATVFLIVSTLTQVVYGCIALYLIDKIRREKADELAKYPDDADVLKLDKAAAAASVRYAAVTRLAIMPRLAKFWLFSSVGTLAVSSYFLFFVPSYFFEHFQMTDDIHHVLCWTCEAAIIKMPLGWISLVALIYGSFALWMFERWANKQAKNQPVDDVKAHDELTGAGHVASSMGDESYGFDVTDDESKRWVELAQPADVDVRVEASAAAAKAAKARAAEARQAASSMREAATEAEARATSKAAAKAARALGTPSECHSGGGLYEQGATDSPVVAEDMSDAEAAWVGKQALKRHSSATNDVI